MGDASKGPDREGVIMRIPALDILVPLELHATLKPEDHASLKELALALAAVLSAEDWYKPGMSVWLLNPEAVAVVDGHLIRVYRYHYDMIVDFQCWDAWPPLDARNPGEQQWVVDIIAMCEMQLEMSPEIWGRAPKN